MKRTTLILVLVLMVSSLTLQGGAKYVSRWKNPDAKPETWKGKKVLAMVRTRVLNARPGAEQAVVRELEKLGIQGVLAQPLTAEVEEKRDREQAKRILNESGIAGAVITHVIEVKEEMLVGSGQTPYLTRDYMTFYSGWETGWEAANYGPGSMTPNATLVVETLVYSVAQDKLVWRGTSEISNPKEVDKIVQQLISATSKELKKAGLVAK